MRLWLAPKAGSSGSQLSPVNLRCSPSVLFSTVKYKTPSSKTNIFNWWISEEDWKLQLNKQTRFHPLPTEAMGKKFPMIPNISSKGWRHLYSLCSWCFSVKATEPNLEMEKDPLFEKTGWVLIRSVGKSQLLCFWETCGRHWEMNCWFRWCWRNLFSLQNVNFFQWKALIVTSNS